MGKFLQTSQDILYKRLIQNENTIQEVSEETTRNYNNSVKQTRDSYTSRNIQILENSANTIIP